MATHYSRTACSPICDHLLSSHHRNADISCQMSIQRTGRLSINDKFSKYHMLAGMAPLPRSSHLNFFFSLCLHFISCGFGLIRTKNDYEQIGSKAKLDRLSCFHYEQNHMPASFQFYTLQVRLGVCVNAFLAVWLALLDI